MEWPHDPDGDDGSEGGRLYGMAILAKKVERDEFPITLEEFAAEVGHHPIRIDDSRVVSADDILAGVDASVADDLETFHRLVGNAMREYGYWTYDPAAEVSRA